MLTCSTISRTPSIAALEAERLLAEEEEADPADIAASSHYTGTDKV